MCVTWYLIITLLAFKSMAMQMEALKQTQHSYGRMSTAGLYPFDALAALAHQAHVLRRRLYFAHWAALADHGGLDVGQHLWDTQGSR